MSKIIKQNRSGLLLKNLDNRNLAITLNKFNLYIVDVIKKISSQVTEKFNLEKEKDILKKWNVA